MMMSRIYLDHTATTPLDPRVLDAMTPYFSGTFGNASSVHWFGQQAKAALERARATIAGLIGAEPGEVFFTSGGTESDNLAITGTARAASKRGKNHIVTSQAEHHAVLECCESLEKNGFEVTTVRVNAYGSVETATVRQALGTHTALVSIMHANNEVGTISPVAEISAAAHEAGAVMHTDAVQSLGKIPVDVKSLGVDLMTISAHKLYGPKGIGALFVRHGTDIDPLLHGGGQERGKRPGTENVALAVGFARAVELSIAEMGEESSRLKELRDTLEKGLQTAFPEIIVNGDPANRLPHILNVSFDSNRIRLEGEMLLVNMDLRGVAVTSGSACTSGSMQPSHVLIAMGRDVPTAKGTLRFAFGKSNTEDDVRFVINTLKEVVEQMTRAN
jgi:cysteine desulfurase